MSARSTRSERIADVRRQCDARGIQIEQRGEAFHLAGHGVDIWALDLALVRDADLSPPYPRDTEER